MASTSLSQFAAKIKLMNEILHSEYHGEKSFEPIDCRYCWRHINEKYRGAIGPVKKVLILFVCLCIVQFAFANRPALNFVSSRVAFSNNEISAVVYNSPPEDGGSVFFSVLDSTNQFLCRSKIVNAGLKGYGQHADIGIDIKNRITIVWEQREVLGSFLYKATFSLQGKLLDSVQLLTDSLVSATMPRIAVHSEGKSIAVWNDYRLGTPALFAQRYFGNGQKKGKNFLVAMSKTLLQFPNVNIGSDSSLYFVWEDSERGEFHIYFCSVSWDISSFSKVVQVDNSNGAAYASTPDLIIQSANKCTIVWKDYREGESNIYLQRMRCGIPNSSNVKVNDDTVRLWQRLPCIDGTRAGYFVCVWEDYRNDVRNQTGDIYAQLYFQNGLSAGENMKINRGGEPVAQRFPAVAMNAGGNFVVTWNESAEKHSQICLQRFNAIGKPVFPIAVMPAN